MATILNEISEQMNKIGNKLLACGNKAYIFDCISCPWLNKCSLTHLLIYFINYLTRGNDVFLKGSL